MESPVDVCHSSACTAVTTKIREVIQFHEFGAIRYLIERNLIDLVSGESKTVEAFIYQGRFRTKNKFSRKKIELTNSRSGNNKVIERIPRCVHSSDSQVENRINQNGVVEYTVRIKRTSGSGSIIIGTKNHEGLYIFIQT
jgi:cellulose biosynthesis protein BcsQ